MVNNKKSALRAMRRSLTTRSSSRGVGIVRISAGEWRKTPVAVPDAEGLRPTPDRVRETLFNWLQFLRGDVTRWSVLDLFAGTGILGLEAASRGAAEVDFFERNPVAVRALRGMIEKLGAKDRCHVHGGDAFSLIERCTTVYDLVFIDPPYDAQLQEKAIRAVLQCLNTDGLLYVETPDSFLSEEVLVALGLVRVRGDRAGVVHFQLLARAESGIASLAKPLKEKKNDVCDLSRNL